MDGRNAEPENRPISKLLPASTVQRKSKRNYTKTVRDTLYLIVSISLILHVQEIYYPFSS